MESKKGVTGSSYASGGAVQFTSASFPLGIMLLPVAGSPGVVLMSDPETEAFLACDVVSSVGGSVSSVTWCQCLSARCTCPLPLSHLFHNSFLHRACAGDSGRDLGEFTWYRKNRHSICSE